MLAVDELAHLSESDIVTGQCFHMPKASESREVFVGPRLRGPATGNSSHRPRPRTSAKTQHVLNLESTLTCQS